MPRKITLVFLALMLVAAAVGLFSFFLPNGPATEGAAIVPNRNDACNPSNYVPFTDGKPTPAARSIEREPTKGAKRNGGLGASSSSDKADSKTQPDLSPPSSRRICAAQPRRPVTLSARGKTDEYRSACLIPPKRQSGSNPGLPLASESTTRRIHGRVFELQEAQRIPLQDVIIHDPSARHRAISDAEGRFAFDCLWAPATDSEGYSVTLAAVAPGYSMFLNRRDEIFYQSEIESRDGVSLYVVPVENQVIEVSIVNPGITRSELTVTAASIPGPQSPVRDERMCVSTVIDPDGKAWFSVPPGRFVVKSVIGDDVQADWANTVIPPLFDENESPLRTITYAVSLISSDNTFVSGSVADLRAGNALTAALVLGADNNEITVPDNQGRFGMWMSTMPRNARGHPLKARDQHLLVEAEGYLSALTPIDFNKRTSKPGDGVQIGPGGGLEGPWLIKLRPWVDSRGRIQVPGYVHHQDDTVEVLDLYDDGLLSFSRRVSLDAEGNFVFQRIPWGIQELRVTAHGGGKKRVLKGTIAESCWAGDEPYQLEVMTK